MQETQRDMVQPLVPNYLKCVLRYWESIGWGSKFKFSLEIGENEVKDDIK